MKLKFYFTYLARSAGQSKVVRELRACIKLELEKVCDPEKIKLGMGRKKMKEYTENTYLLFLGVSQKRTLK